jgi:hypothetical protein
MMDVAPQPNAEVDLWIPPQNKVLLRVPMRDRLHAASYFSELPPLPLVL